ncbi:phage head-tail adapter protein [Xenorhabdus vietnamensis]|uniref:Phage head-tail adapter protein n=1 Tax=Xenorhabdus vietnamensis TaxID=351656 RepID=A0A1Y2S841_9GAMM|nr:gpW family head-tail joining protein [Xenorhabdus vietnamensis]OTA14090.1 phage head-tail adapter protein [Xenorhabdus vietnamensis]OTA14219.1 phage head-tail adapter protein [Xenorhabdus vietnamensis]
MRQRTSLLTGMSREQLKTALNTAQQAYIELSTGTKGVSFSYTQGDGTRSVSYQQTSLGDLLALIQAIQTELGITTRRPIRVRY